MAAPHIPRDAALWLTVEQQEEWLKMMKQVPTLVFASFLAFNVLAWFSLRMINKKGTIKHPKNLALIKAGACAATHAVVSLAASGYALVHRDLGACGEQDFCYDDMSARLMTVHAGYALFEFLFWQNNSKVAAPWNEMLLLHDAITVLQAVSYLLYPCRLSLILLPLHQLLELATLVDCARRFTAIYGAPWHSRFKAQLSFCGAYILKAVVGAGLAAYAYFWIRGHNLWRLELPEGASMLNGVYGMIWLAGSTVQAMIYIKWMGAAVAMTNDLLSSVPGQRATAAGGAAATLAAGGGGGSAKKRGKREEKKQR